VTYVAFLGWWRKKEGDAPQDFSKSQDTIFVTTETEIELKKCKVTDDGKINYGRGIRDTKTIDILTGRDAHTFVMHRSMLPIKRIKLFLLKVPKWLIFRTYTARKEGEITHDPNQDHLDPELKTRLETILQIKAIGAKAEWAKAISEGLRDTQPWWEKLGGLIAVTVVVFLFLFAFQIQPNL
jgi:hypothetical protein